MESVPLLDLQDFLHHDEEVRGRFIQDFGNAIEELGFVRIDGHGVDPALIQSAYAECQKFFNGLTLEQRMECYSESAKGNRGFIPFGKEKAKDAAIADQKSFYHVGREISPSHPYYATYGPNYFPSVLPSFQEITTQLYSSLEEVADKLLSSLALYMGDAPDFFVPVTKDGNSILRLIHYPSAPLGFPPGSMRAAAHEDINLITLLPSATSSGLEILRRSDMKWIACDEQQGELVVDGGDMLMRLTRIFKSTTHRVVNPTGDDAAHERFSMPFFVHPNPEAILDAARLPSLASKIQAQGLEPLPPITANDYLMERLREIGVL